jgi:glycerol-3-phosphate acyltransferase PlsY
MIIKKQDIRSLGGGNAGASNMVVSFGWKIGTLVALLDIFKAIISIFIIRYLISISVLENNIFYIYLNGFFVILGHNYPFYMNFKGGKGTASTFGMLMAIDYRLGIIGFFLVLIVTLVTDFIALGALALVMFLILGTMFLKLGNPSIFIAVLITLLAIYKHIPNIKNILAKKEDGISRQFKKKSKI